MKIACVSYRDWALSIYDQLAEDSTHEFLIIRSKDEYDEETIRDFAPDLILFYGWSWIIEQKLINEFQCLMLHPSPLPKYRGGSPIQNQIINGEDTSAVTIFLMDEGMDTGPILAQKEISLLGNLSEIFDRMTAIGVELTRKILKEGLHPVPQDDSKATICKRRKPQDSEITLEEIQTKPARYLHDKIRMLQDPYPNAYIVTADGKKLYLTQSSIGEK